jgi:hypothetical protein
VVQARRFGAELLLARPLVHISPDGPGYVAELSDSTVLRAPAMLYASGVEWRRAEESLGRAVGENRHDVELALQVSFWRGAAVLHPGTTPGAAGAPKEKADS